MVTVSLSKSAEDGSSYFGSDDGYYVAPPKSTKWYGRGADKLGLIGEVYKRDLDVLLTGYSPQTNEKLVKNADAEDIFDEDGKLVKRGRVAYIDVHAAVPKSASILGVIDPKIEQAHNRAIEKLIALLEADYSYTRREDEESGVIETVKSDNLTIAKINHYESRDLDPQLHSHLVLMNLTQGEDKKWRSINAAKIYIDQKYLGQIYRSELAKGLKGIGYEIDVTDPVDGLFEIKGVDPEIIEKYSKRRVAIEEKLEEYEAHGIYENLPGREKSQKACLATRKRKQGIKPEEMRKKLDTELGEIGQSLEAIQRNALRYGATAPAEPPRSAEQCIRDAINDIMDKQAVTTEKAVINLALKGCMGYYTAAQLADVLRKQPDWEVLGLKDNDGFPAIYYTTTETRRAEQAVIGYAMRDRGHYGRAISADKMDEHAARIVGEGTNLSTGQSNAVRMICTARDRISIVQGDAGAGKTFAMETVRDILAKAGITVRGFAPTGKASDELNKAGVPAMTIHSYLKSPAAQAEAGEGEVWLVDEAGMLGSRRLDAFLEKASEKNARVILIGDDKQFQSVEQGKIFQSLQDLRGIVQKAEITEVKRQKTEHAKTIVAAVKDKDFDTVFDTLDRHNGLIEITDPTERNEYIVNELVKDIANGVESVALTANNDDKDRINGKTREKLAEIGIVNMGTPFDTYQKRDLNNIAKTFGQAYDTDAPNKQAIITRRDCGDIPRGTLAAITEVDTDNDTIKVSYYDKKAKRDAEYTIELRKHATKFDVYDMRKKYFGAGDSVIFTKNDKAVGVCNGQTGTIQEIDGDGNAKIKVGKKTIECNLRNRGDKSYAYVDYAYCLTSHKSQGSTYDRIIVNADVSGQKTSYNAFYVQMTRARYDMAVVTNDKAKLAKQATVRENKASTLDAVFNDFALQQAQEMLRVAEQRAEQREEAEKYRAEQRAIAEKAAMVERINKEAAATITTSTPNAQDSSKIKGHLAELKDIQGAIDHGELQKRFAQRYSWTIYNPPQQDRYGNHIVAELHDRQARDNANALYIVAQPQEDGNVTIWASVGELKDTANANRAARCKDMLDAKTLIERNNYNVFLSETVNRVKNDLAKSKPVEAPSKEKEDSAKSKPAEPPSKEDDSGYYL